MIVQVADGMRSATEGQNQTNPKRVVPIARCTITALVVVANDKRASFGAMSDALSGNRTVDSAKHITA